MSSFGHQHGQTNGVSVANNNDANAYSPTLYSRRMFPKG